MRSKAIHNMRLALEEKQKRHGYSFIIRCAWGIRWLVVRA
jgi:hypothetical protein